MDGISSAAAVIGLVQAATQVTTALGRYVSRVKEAESSRAKLLDQIRLISAAETAISSIVQNSPLSVHSQELQALIDEWFRVDGTSMKCKRELDALASWLEKEVQETSKRKRWVQKMGWPVKEDKIQATIRVFEGYMPYFRDILSIKTFNLVDSMVTSFKNTELADAKFDLLSWFDGFDCMNKHESTLQQRQRTTGDWLFKEELYNEWRKGSTKFIWLHGKAGAGKSVLASAVIDDASNELADNETLAYFYCDFRNNRCTSAMEVLRSVTKQLLWNSKKDWLSSFSDLTARKQRGSGPPTNLGTLSELLIRAAELHERPMIVVDALDECEDLSNLLDELAKLARGHCLLFVTSRTLHAIKEAFKDLSTIALDDRVDEMWSDIHFHIKTELESRPRLKVLMQNLKDEIEGVLMKQAEGMFRWVQCQLDRLNDCYSLGDVREVLDTLPATLYETYDQMLRAIDKKPFGRRIARKALRWLAIALSPLTLSQLEEALAISCNEPVLDSAGALIHESVIVEILGSLVTVEEEEVITLSHYSVKEYLTSNTLADNIYFVDQLNASLELATVSIFCLILLSDGLETTMNDEKLPLHRYAIEFGLQHLADCHSDHNNLLMRHLLTLQSHISTHRHIYQRVLWSDGWMLTTSQLALYIIIRFGHSTLLRHYLDCFPVRATEEDNPLLFAAFYGDIPRVQILLDEHLDVNLESPLHAKRCTLKLTPLIAAARNKTEEHQPELVQLLLENGCLVPKDAIHRTFECDMGTPCQPAVVRILLEHGADPRLPNSEGRSGLHVFLTSGYGTSSDDDIEIIHMLVAAGCDPMAPDIWGTSSLQLAMERPCPQDVQWLVESNFQLPPDAVLRLFSSEFLIHSVQILLSMLVYLVRNGADLDARDARGSNALHLFSAHMSLIDYEFIQRILLLLVDHGCNINWKNDAGETPLHLAATSLVFNSDILDLFLAKGAELPLDIINYAVEKAHWKKFPVIATLTSLVKRLGASCRSKTINGDNALHRLLKHSYFGIGPEIIWEVASFLVKNGCDVHAIASSGETPLELAIEHGYFPLAQSILALDKPYFAGHIASYYGDSKGDGIIHRLCDSQSYRFENKVKLLREAGYDFARDINRPNKKGFTPLCIAVMFEKAAHDPAIVPCLLDLGASFYYVNYLHSMDNLEWASNLPWYRDATDAHERYLNRSNITPDHVNLVQDLLRAAHQGRLSPAVTRSILDMAEYWACMKITRHNIQYTGKLANVGNPILFPTVLGDAGCWVPRRLAFTWKVVFKFPHRIEGNFVNIRLLVRRKTGPYMFIVPVSIEHYSLPSRVGFDIWDVSTPAQQVGGRERLMVGELTPEDTLNVEFHDTTNEYVAFEFLQIEVYYATKPGHLTRD